MANRTTKKNAKTYADPLGPLTRCKMSLLDAVDELREQLDLRRVPHGMWPDLEGMPPAAARAELELLVEELLQLVPRVAPPARRLRAVGGRCPF